MGRINHTNHHVTSSANEFFVYMKSLYLNFIFDCLVEVETVEFKKAPHFRPIHDSINHLGSPMAAHRPAQGDQVRRHCHNTKIGFFRRYRRASRYLVISDLCCLKQRTAEKR